MTDFGRDLYCLDHAQPGRMVSGLMAVAQNAYRFCITPPGTLRGTDEDLSFGIDLPGLVGQLDDDQLAATLPARVHSGLTQADERILDTATTITRSTDGPSSSWMIGIACTTAEGPFKLVLSVDELTVELLGVAA